MERTQITQAISDLTARGVFPEAPALDRQAIADTKDALAQTLRELREVLPAAEQRTQRRLEDLQAIRAAAVYLLPGESAAMAREADTLRARQAERQARRAAALKVLPRLIAAAERQAATLQQWLEASRDQRSLQRFERELGVMDQRSAAPGQDAWTEHVLRLEANALDALIAQARR